MITDNKRSFSSHQIPGGYSPYHLTLLQERRKRKRKNLGRRNCDSTTDGHKLAEP